MRKKYYIFGTNSTAELLYYYLKKENIIIDGFLVNEEYIDKFKGKLPARLFSAEAIIGNFDSENIGVYLSIGYSNMNRTRSKVFTWLKSMNVSVLNYIHPSAEVSDDVIMGEGNIIMEKVVVQPYCKIGDANVFWSGTLIAHHNNIGSFNHFSPSCVLSGEVKIHDRCFLGSNCTIKNSVEICDEVLVGAGTYVATNLSFGSVIVPQRSRILDKLSTDFII